MFILPVLLSAAHALHLEMTRPELCAAVELVAIVEVTNLDPQFNDHGDIERLVHATVLQTVKGPARDSVDFVLPGGEIDGLSLTISETPNLLSDARYMLFLGMQEGRLHIQGGDQGAVRITRDGARRGESIDKAVASVGACNAQ